MSDADLAQLLRSQRTLTQDDVDKVARERDREHYSVQERKAPYDM